MDSVMRLVASSSVISDAEKIVLAENQRLTADEKKRRLLSCGPSPSSQGSGAAVIFPAISNGGPSSVPTTDALDTTPTGDNTQSIPVISGNGNFVCLDQTSNLFIRHAGQLFTQKFFDLANKYELLNTEGVSIFYAGETLEKFGAGKGRSKSTQFDVSVLLPDGTPILNVLSRRGVTTVSDFQKVIGTCIDTSSVLSPNKFYSIRDWNMCEIFLLKRSANGPPGEFDIISKEAGKIGQFTNAWNATLPNYVGMDKLYGISFPLDMCTEEKVLLVGALFTLFFQHLHEGAGNAKQRKFLLATLCITLGIVIVLGIFGLALWGILKND